MLSIVRPVKEPRNDAMTQRQDIQWVIMLTSVL